MPLGYCDCLGHGPLKDQSIGVIWHTDSSVCWLPRDFFRILRKAGANPKAKDSAGKTALDYAQANAKLKCADTYRQLQEASQ